MPPRISTRRRIRTVFCASEVVLAGARQSMHQIAGGKNARCAARFDRIRTRGVFRGGSGPQGHSILESHLVHDHDVPDVPGGERGLGSRTNARMIAMERSTMTSACESRASNLDATM